MKGREPEHGRKPTAKGRGLGTLTQRQKRARNRTTIDERPTNAQDHPSFSPNWCIVVCDENGGWAPRRQGRERRSFACVKPNGQQKRVSAWDFQEKRMAIMMPSQGSHHNPLPPSPSIHPSTLQTFFSISRLSSNSPSTPALCRRHGPFREPPGSLHSTPERPRTADLRSSLHRGVSRGGHQSDPFRPAAPDYHGCSVRALSFFPFSFFAIGFFCLFPPPTHPHTLSHASALLSPTGQAWGPGREGGEGSRLKWRSGSST